MPLTDEPLDTGYREMYNLEFSTAHDTFRSWQQSHPEDPMGYVSDAAAYLFSEFDRLHVLEVELFTDDKKFASRHKLAPDPAVKAAFDKDLAISDQLASRMLAVSAGSEQAMFAQILANGLRGDYAAMIEKRNLAGLSYMKSSRSIAEKLLGRNPQYYDAYLAIGVENYLLGVTPAPVRWLLRFSGAETNKQEGIKRLRLTASNGHYLAPYARLLLAVAALRDKDAAGARALLEDLSREFPHNHLYATELARLAR
ncbi:MAG: hypothetical protein ABSD88_00175 [Candidatus Korobacteraceae bacterium]